MAQSLVAPPGMKATKRKPIWAHTSASAMLVDPLDASVTVMPARNVPLRHAFARMCRAIRSLVEPLGLRYSSLHHTSTPPGSRH